MNEVEYDKAAVVYVLKEILAERHFPNEKLMFVFHCFSELKSSVLCLF